MTEPINRFLVALSFPGEHRKFVEDVADWLSRELGEGRVLYDRFHEAEFARPNLDTHLQALYHDQSRLVVVFLCADYERKEWPGLEWRAIRDLIKSKKDSSIMLIRLDEANVSGVFSIDGYISVEGRAPRDIASLIIERLQILEVELQATITAQSISSEDASGTANTTNLKKKEKIPQPIREVIKRGADFLNEVPAEERFTRRSYFHHLIERHTSLFAGREAQCNDILEFIQPQASGYIFIEALSGYGKTSLLAKLVQENPNFAYHFISQAYKTHGSDFDPTQMDSLVLNLCEQLEARTAGDRTGISPKARLHSLLRATPSSGVRVIVIDAVDEVDRHPNYLLGLFPERLPRGVFVILSARKLGDHNYLSEIGLEKVDKTIPLDGLETKAITQLLSLAGGKAPSFASSEDFVMKLHSVSGGDPFYLRFLIEDVAQGSIREDSISDVPSKLNDYLDMQLSILDRSAHLPQQRDILGVILEAYGPVSRRDLIDMIQGLDGINFQNVIKDIQRFLLVYDDKYTFCHNRFKEYFVSRA